MLKRRTALSFGASGDDFKSLREKVDIFLKNQEGKKFQNKASQLWQINDGIQWRVDQILSDELKANWDGITDDQELIVDVGIACYLRISKQPEKKEDVAEDKYQQSLAKWRDKKQRIEEAREAIAMERPISFEQFVKGYQGELLSGYIDFDDSFSCRIKISGKGLKDIVLNYQYLFEVIEHDTLIITDSVTGEVGDINPELIAPDDNAPKVCIIDSGIQEEHRLLALLLRWIHKNLSHLYQMIREQLMLLVMAATVLGLQARSSILTRFRETANTNFSFICKMQEY